MKRRKFGKIVKRTRKGETVYEASYLVPDNLRSQYPTLPERYYKTAKAAYYSDLEAWLYDAERSIRLGAWKPPTQVHNRRSGKHILFRDYATTYVNTHRKPNGDMVEETTRVNHRNLLNNHLIPFFGDMDMRKITPRHVAQFYEQMPINERTGAGEVNRYNAYRLLKAIFNHALTEPINDIGDKLLTTSPCTLKVSKPITRHTALVASYEELDQLAAALPAYMGLAVYLAGVCGLREGELLALTRADIDLVNRCVNVDKSVKQINIKGQSRRLEVGKPKSRTSVRRVPFPQWLQSIIEQHLQVFTDRAAGALVFPAVNGGYIAPTTLRNRWNNAVKTVPRLAGMHFHDLRHTALTHYGEAGASVAELMELAGHNDIKVVTVYQQISQQQRARTAQRLNSQAVRAVEKPVSTPVVSENSEDNALVSVLAGLPVGAQVAVLKAKGKDTQARVLELLPEEQRVELLIHLL